MERLRMTSDKGGLAFTFDLDITCEKTEIEKIVKIGERLKSYEDTGLEPEEIEAMKNNGGWIPVNDRLPDEPKFSDEYYQDPDEMGVYLVTTKGNEPAVIEIYYAGNGKWIDVDTDCFETEHEVIAWRPLPNPYKPQEQ